MTGSEIRPRRQIFLGGLGLSATLVCAGLLIGPSPVMDRFIATIGALGQMWIAALLLLITYDEFAFNKMASQRQSREANYDRRAELRRNWQQFSRQIGYTALHEDNVAALGRLLAEVRLLFGEPEYQIARQAVAAARAAKRHARGVKANMGVLREDPAYRAEIDKYKDAQSRTWQMLTGKLILDD